MKVYKPVSDSEVARRLSVTSLHSAYYYLPIIQEIFALGLVICERADKPQGEWIVRNDNTYCSECGASEDTFIYGSEYWHGLGLSHYCPNCGMKMKVVKR